MKKTCSRFISSASFALVFLLAGCGEKNSSASRDDESSPTASAPNAGALDATINAYMSELEKMGGVFKQVTDEASAKQHAPAIKAASARLQGYVDQLQGVDPTTRGMAFAAQAQRFMQIQH